MTSPVGATRYFAGTLGGVLAATVGAVVGWLVMAYGVDGYAKIAAAVLLPPAGAGLGGIAGVFLGLALTERAAIGEVAKDDSGSESGTSFPSRGPAGA